MTARDGLLHQRHPPELLERARAEAERRGETLTALVQRAIERELEVTSMRTELESARFALRKIAELATPLPHEAADEKKRRRAPEHRPQGRALVAGEMIQSGDLVLAHGKWSTLDARSLTVGCRVEPGSDGCFVRPE